MKNTAKRLSCTSDDVLTSLLSAARNEERRKAAFAFSLRMEALAIYITDEEMSGKEVAELLQGEASRFQYETQELH